MNLEATLYTLEKFRPPDADEAFDCHNCDDVMMAFQEAGIPMGERTSVSGHDVLVNHHPNVDWSLPDTHNRQEFRKFRVEGDPEEKAFSAPLLHIESTDSPYDDKLVPFPTAKEANYSTHHIIEGAWQIRKYLRDALQIDLVLEPYTLRELKAAKQAERYASISDFSSDDLVVQTYLDNRFVVISPGEIQEGREELYGKFAWRFTDPKAYVIKFDGTTVTSVRPLENFDFITTTDSQGIYFSPDSVHETFKVKEGSDLQVIINRHLSSPRE